MCRYAACMARKPKRKKPTLVVSRHGRYRFQTGMVTASLLRRGLRMADAMEIARAVRDSIAGKSEISTDKLSLRIENHIERRLGSAFVDPAAPLQEGDEALPMIETARGTFPFSKGIVLRALDAAGLDSDDAIRLVVELDRWVRTQSEAALDEDDIHDEVIRLLGLAHGADVARRYQLTGWVRHSDTPIILLIGGATGTGKSTLTMELAYRLGVLWVTSTDMIRETMRTVLSSELVPGLHDHSFRGMVLGGQVLSDPRERVLAGFRQQAAQVAVGVRAVIKRAIRENAHIIIEGTHIAPPFRRYLDEGVEAHLAGFILAIPDEVKHRKRFPKRALKQMQRSAGTYLDAFQSVRWIHDDLLRLAEETETIVLPNMKLDRTLLGAVDFLSRELPVEEGVAAGLPSEMAPSGPDIPTLFLIIDGLADDPNEALGGKTPLQAAHTPHLRQLAAAGGQGQIFTGRQEGEIPSTDEGMLALLGAPGDNNSSARGFFEALGQGLPIPPGAVMFRGNLATVESDGAIVDRRAGRIRDGVEDLLADLKDVELAGGITGKVVAGLEHRVIVMLQGAGLSAAVADTDPGSAAAVQRVLPLESLDESPEAARTVEALRQLLKKASKHMAKHSLNAIRLDQGLPQATAILTRGAARADHRGAGSGGRRGAMVAGCPAALGVARYVGLQTASSIAMTGSLDTDLDAKFDTAADLLEEQDFVVIHIKGTDVAAHDRRPLEKRDFLSAIDAALGRFLKGRPDLSRGLRIVVAADHGTSSITGDHLADPVPLLLGTWQDDSDDEEDFDEESAAHGALGLLRGGELTELLGLGRRYPGPTNLPTPS